MTAPIDRRLAGFPKNDWLSSFGDPDDWKTSTPRRPEPGARLRRLLAEAGYSAGQVNEVMFQVVMHRWTADALDARTVADAITVAESHGVKL